MITIPVGLGHNEDTVSLTSIGFSTTAQINTGDTVFVAVILQSSNSVIVVNSVSDGTNNYTKRNQINDGPTTYDMELWMVDHAASVAAGATLQVSYASATPAGSINIAAAKVSGLATSAVDLIASGHSGATTSLSTTTGIALSQPNEIIIGASGINFGIGGSVPETQSAGFSNIIASAQAVSALALDFQIVNSLVIATYAPTWGATGGAVTQLLTTLNGGAVVNVAVQGLASCEW